MSRDYFEGFESGSVEMASRMRLFKQPMKVNAIIEALGIFHRSLNDRFECQSPHAALRKIGYLEGVFHTSLSYIAQFEGAPLSKSVVIFTIRYQECMMRVLSSNLFMKFSNYNSVYNPNK
ncbi:MAG: hypothetical protein ACK4HV_06035 [Parachlamydiaceae bacterium]